MKKLYEGYLRKYYTYKLKALEKQLDGIYFGVGLGRAANSDELGNYGFKVLDTLTYYHHKIAELNKRQT